MSTSTDKEKKTQSQNAPEPKIGDATTPEEKEQAKPVKRALKEAIKEVDSPDKADEVIEKLEAAAAEKTVTDVKESQPPVTTPAQAAQKVSRRLNLHRKAKRRKRFSTKQPRLLLPRKDASRKLSLKPCRKY